MYPPSGVKHDDACVCATQRVQLVPDFGYVLPVTYQHLTKDSEAETTTTKRERKKIIKKREREEYK